MVEVAKAVAVTAEVWGKKVRENQTLLSKYFGGSTLKEIGSAFKRIDADGNASLSWEEFVAAAGLALPAAPEPEAAAPEPETVDGSKGLEELRKLFETLDKDHDGR